MEFSAAELIAIGAVILNINRVYLSCSLEEGFERFEVTFKQSNE